MGTIYVALDKKAMNNFGHIKNETISAVEVVPMVINMKGYSPK